MLAERASVAERGAAEIEQMRETAESVRVRAMARVGSMRAESRLIDDLSKAEASDIKRQVQSVRLSTETEIKRLGREMQSIREESIAASRSLRAQAQLHEEKGINQSYQVSLTAADASFEQDRADAGQLFQSAQTVAQEGAAEVDRAASEAEKQLELDRVIYQESLAEVRSYVSQKQSEIDLMRAEAMKIERSARAQFVRDDSQARANAVRAESDHQIALAEDEATRIRAEADALAAKLQAELAEHFAKQVAAGKVTLNVSSGPDAVSSDLSIPAFTYVPKRSKRIQPEHVARFQASLAQAAMGRLQAEALSRQLNADAAARTSGYKSWWRQQQTKFDASMAVSDALSEQIDAQVNEIYAQAEGRVSEATALRDHRKNEAESQRIETEAQIARLVAEANFVDKKADAGLVQLGVELAAVSQIGNAEAKSLQVAMESTLQRGGAISRKLSAEADAAASNLQIAYAQMTKEIDSSEAILASNLTQLQQAANSYVAMAEATYSETQAVAASFDRISDAKSTVIVAQNQASRDVEMANAAYGDQVVDANRLLANAQVARRVADAQIESALAKVEDGNRRAQILAMTKMADAEVSAQFIIASAIDRSIASRFDSRVAMVQGERNKAYASQYLDHRQQEARALQAYAAAAAYRELSNEAIARMNARNQAFQQTAQAGWSRDLAAPGTFFTSEDAASLYDASESFFATPASTLATVPVTDD